MEELLPVISDDLDWAESGHTARTPAEHTRYFGWEGQWYRLDMTTPHTTEIEEFLARYLRAGQKSAGPPAGGDRRGLSYRNKAIKAFADEHGLPYTVRKAGGYYFPVATRRAFEAQGLT